MTTQGNDYSPGTGFRFLFGLSLILLLFSGFGQMPVFKRYYLADVPGLAWTADFFITLTLHYLAAALFLALIAYYLVMRLTVGTRRGPVGGREWARLVVYLALIVSGIGLVALNINGISTSPLMNKAYSLSHLAATMIFIILTVTYFRFGRTKKAREGRLR